MLTRLAGLAAVTTAATVGVLIYPALSMALDVKRALTERHYDWDTYPVPASVAHREAA
jgi:hypothetical protein